MPTMLRTSEKARKIAFAILGEPITKESKKSKKESRDMAKMILREEERKAR